MLIIHNFLREKCGYIFFDYFCAKITDTIPSHVFRVVLFLFLFASNEWIITHNN